MGADALRAALTDAGISWSDVQTCFAGSLEVSNPDSVVAKIGLTGIPCCRGCSTAVPPPTPHCRWRPGRLNTVRLTSRSPSVSTSIPAVRSRLIRRCWSARLVRRNRDVSDDPFLRHEDQPVHARIRHHPDDVGAGGGQELPVTASSMNAPAADPDERGISSPRRT